MRITQGALIEGIEKALTFEGLMMLSKASIAPGLKLPGRIGRIVAASFVYYDRIVEYKGRIKASSLSRDADDLMLRVWGFADAANANAANAEAADEGFPAAAAIPEAPVSDASLRGRGNAILVFAGLAAWALTITAAADIRGGSAKRGGARANRPGPALFSPPREGAQRPDRPRRPSPRVLAFDDYVDQLVAGRR